MLRKQPLVDPARAGALAAAVENLERILREEKVSLNQFFYHLLPLAADIGGLRELVEVALTKTMGRAEMVPRLPGVYGEAIEVKNAFQAAFPKATENLPATVEPWMRRWNLHGPGLVAGVIHHTEPDIFVEEATMVVVHPALGGGGQAYLPYNLALLEGVEADPVPDLPEELRLTWLLAQLNLDLPAYSEKIHPHRLEIVAGLTMIPVILKAGEANQLASCDPTTIALAVQSWMPPGMNNGDWTSTLNQWWDVYQVMRPGWSDAMQAFDQLLPKNVLFNGDGRLNVPDKKCRPSEPLPK
jgi:hypothetical protein